MTMSCDNIVLSGNSETPTHKNILLRKSISKKLLFNIHPSVSPKSIFEHTDVFHRLFHRYDTFTVIIIVKKKK